MVSYGQLVTSVVAGQQLYGSVSTGNALDTAYRGGVEAPPTVLDVYVSLFYVNSFTRDRL